MTKTIMPQPLAKKVKSVLQSDFEEQIAGARTFVFVREVQMLLEANLIKGGDLDNALVIYDEPLAQDRLNAQ